MSDASGAALGRLAHELVAPVTALRDLATAAREPRRSVPPARLLELAIAAARDIERLLADPELRDYRHAAVSLDDVLAALAVGREERVHLDATPGLAVLGDATRLRQALGNLVSNGLRHGERVTVTARDEDGEVVIVVADDGQGVASGLDLFADGVSGAGSTGLGLGIARRVAEAHGGSLALVPSTSGARFRLALPSSAAAR